MGIGRRHIFCRPQNKAGNPLDIPLISVIIILMLTSVHAVPLCEVGANIGKEVGVKIEPISGSRVELGPLPDSQIITVGSMFSVSFRPESTSGLVFAAFDNRTSDMVATFIRKGHLAFARRCDKFYYTSIGHRLILNQWYTISYRHSSRGGVIYVDGFHDYRKYHMWGCQNLTQLYFGSLPQSIKHNVYWQDLSRQFSGCLKNININGTVPSIAPRYVLASTCDEHVLNNHHGMTSAANHRRP